MVALGDIAQSLHDALDIDHHGFDRAGDNSQFLLQEVAGDGNAVAHQDFVGGTAHTGQVDALGAFGFGISDQSPGPG